MGQLVFEFDSRGCRFCYHTNLRRRTVLGLVRQTMLAHRGSVRVIEAPGGGVRFELLFSDDADPAQAP